MSYPFWTELVQIARSSGLFVHVDTNAIGLRMDNATSNIIRQSVNLLGFPIDGASAAVHDAVRNTTGHFDVVVAKARWVRQFGAAIKVNTIVTSRNMEEVEKMFDLIRDLAPTRWSLYQYWPLSHGARAREQYQLTDIAFARMISALPNVLGRTIIESNPRLSRRLTYPIVSHTGEVYVHSRIEISDFEFLGSIFLKGTMERALEICAGDRFVAMSRYR